MIYSLIQVFDLIPVTVQYFLFVLSKGKIFFFQFIGN
jgi:hypothetical protein